MESWGRERWRVGGRSDGKMVEKKERRRKAGREGRRKEKKKKILKPCINVSSTIREEWVSQCEGQVIGLVLPVATCHKYAFRITSVESTVT